MTHLSAAELVDYAERTLDGARATHVDQCERCRHEGNALRATLAQASAVDRDVPEPSPLFWDHFSARVNEGIAEVPSRSLAWGTFGVRTFVPLGAFAVILAVLLVPLINKGSVGPATSHIADTRSAAYVEVDQPLDPSEDPTTAEVWEVLTAAGADLEWDAAHEAGMGVAPATIDRAVQQLSTAELRELGRLLQTELKRSGN